MTTRFTDAHSLGRSIKAEAGLIRNGFRCAAIAAQSLVKGHARGVFWGAVGFVECAYCVAALEIERHTGLRLPIGGK